MYKTVLSVPVAILQQTQSQEHLQYSATILGILDAWGDTYTTVEGFFLA